MKCKLIAMIIALLLALTACAPAAPPAPQPPPVQAEPAAPAQPQLKPGPNPTEALTGFVAERLSIEVADQAMKLEFEDIPYLLPVPAGSADNKFAGYQINAVTYDQEDGQGTAAITVGGQTLVSLHLSFDTSGEQLTTWPGSTLVIAGSDAVLPGTSKPADPSLTEIIEKSPYHDLLLPLPGYWQGGYRVEFNNDVEQGGLGREYILTFYEGHCYELDPEYRAGMVFFIYRTPLEPLLVEVPKAMTEIFFAADYVFATDGLTAYVCAFPTGVEYPSDAPPLAKARYKAMAANANQVLLQFVKENGLMPNPEYFK